MSCVIRWVRSADTPILGISYTQLRAKTATKIHRTCWILICIFLGDSRNKRTKGAGLAGRYSETPPGDPDTMLPELFGRVRWWRESGVWDRPRVRLALGGGLPFLFFRLQVGFTIPPYLRFPWPPYHAGRPSFSRSGLQPWHFVHEPSPSDRGSSGGARTPRLRRVYTSPSIGVAIGVRRR